MTIYAEDVNFWKSGKSAPDHWLDRTKTQIVALGGKVAAEGFGSGEDGRSAYMLAFRIKGDTFKIVWPVLPTRRSGEERAARIQAATMLYHYVKATCLYAIIVGARTAFFAHYMLPDGRTAAQVVPNELASLTPSMLMLTQGDTT